MPKSWILRQSRTFRVGDRLGRVYSTERTTSFSDGVFTISITLLALTIQLPTFPQQPTEAELWQALQSMVQPVGLFALSFFVIALFWMAHHRMFRYIRQVDGGLTWLNVLFLFWIALVPIPSALLGRFAPLQPVVIVYAAAMALTGLTELLMWRYVSAGQHLLAPDLSETIIRYRSKRMMITPLVFLFSIAVALFNPLYAMLSWNLIWIFLISLNRYYHDKFD
jgi:uncharacterized membrane protein